MISMESGGICMVNLVNTLLTLLTLSLYARDVGAVAKRNVINISP